MTKKNITIILKSVVTVLLIVFLMWMIDWRESFKIISGITIPMVGVLFLITFFMIGISCLKWKIFLKARQVYVDMRHLFLLYLIGYFFNNFLPSNVGGDVARAVILGKQINSASDSFSSVFLERFTGLLGLLILACLVFILNMKLIQIPSIGIFLYIFLAAFIAVTFLLLSERSRKLFNVVLGVYPLRLIKDKLLKFLDAIYYFRNKPLVLTQAMLISFLFHFMTVVNTLAVCHALDIPVRIMDLATIVPIILLISVFPVSLNGIGVWEGSFVYFFSLIGVEPAAALSVALVLRGVNIVISLMGGLGLLFLNKFSKSDFTFDQTV